jgi:hypothetical protein
MELVRYIFMVAGVLGWLGALAGSTAMSSQNDVPEPLLIGDLEPKFDGKEVTIKFTVTKLDGIAQFTKEGQAPSFAIETERGNQKNMLSVWIEGELANVLDRLQMGAFQDTPLKAGTVIAATGKLTIHKSIPNQYFFSVTKWQGFRILPAKRDK